VSVIRHDDSGINASRPAAAEAGRRRGAVAPRPDTLCTLAACIFLLAACSSHAPPKVDDTRVKEFAGRGYLTDDRFSVGTTFSNWTVGEDSFDIAWTVPVSGQRLPVVVYLPGLGESRSSGEKWRTAWALAGYAVLSVQLLDADQHVWSSNAARGGDLVMLARERYAKEAAAARLKGLTSLLAELQKHHGSDEALLQRLDLSRIAIAGFDVGAYTAMLVAGETPKGEADPIRLPIPISAFVALSPYADFSGKAFSARYQSITAPVLSVSGNADADNAGVVSSPSVRKAPFEYMPSHDAYLLWLRNATHAVFSGSGPSMLEDSADSATPRHGDGQGSPQGGSRRGRHGGNGQSGTASGNPGGFGDRQSTGAAASPTERALSANLIQGVTTAFLDSYLKQDPTAKEWLQKDVARWLGERGELKRK